jgi:hypothetical protein
MPKNKLPKTKTKNDSVAPVQLVAHVRKRPASSSSDSKHDPKKPRQAKNYDELEVDPELDVDPAALEVHERDLDAPPMVRPFKLSMVGADYTLGFVGKRREGKSYMMRWLAASQVKRFPRVYVFTNTRYVTLGVLMLVALMARMCSASVAVRANEVALFDFGPVKIIGQHSNISNFLCSWAVIKVE